MIPLFHVCADPDTGQWLTDLQQVGEVDQAKFLKHINTEKHHYDTFEHQGVTSAIIIEWWKDE
jgi:hypothetical protein